MTDKEKIRAEIEKLCEIVYLPCNKKRHGFKMGFMNAIDEVIKIFDSMQEEPTTSVWHDKEEKPDIEKRIFAICVLDRPFAGYYNEINPRYIRRWAYIDDILNLSNVQRTAKKEEPVSEDLDSFATKYAQDKPYPVTVCQAVRVGARWQYEQIMKGAVDVEVWDEKPPHITYFPKSLKGGDKVKLIIIKED